MKRKFGLVLYQNFIPINDINVLTCEFMLPTAIISLTDLYSILKQAPVSSARSVLLVQ